MKLYGDLGKTAKKLFTDDFVADTKVSIKTKTANGVAFTIDNVKAAKDDSLVSTVSLKYKVYGNALTTKLLSSGKVSTEATIDQLGVDGLKAVLNGAIAESTQAASAKLEYIHPHLAATTLVDVFKGPSVHSTVALGLGPNTVGAEVNYDTGKAGITSYALAVSRADAESEMTAHLTDKLRKIKAAYCHSVSSTMTVGASISYDRDSEATAMAMGVKSVLDKTTTVKAKLDTKGSLALAYVSTIRPETTMVLSTVVDLQKFEASPTLGFSLTYDA
mmetsp:Transcript_44970/g.110387  ORF Transcript_44970/g.110387 Transcript_44970/m.110387 type:complete len:275 (+) Transcript_44970:2378-3202(+)